MSMKIDIKESLLIQRKKLYEMFCIQIFAGCGTPALVIHKTVLETPEINDIIIAVKELQIIKTDEMIYFEEYYLGVGLKIITKTLLR